MGLAPPTALLHYLGQAETQPMTFSQVSDPLAGASLPPKKFNDILRRAVDLAELVHNFKCNPSSPLPPTNDPVYRPLGSSH